MDGPVVPWRRTLPRLSRHRVVRPRVAAMLDRRLPLTVLTAPHGYGKSVALHGWINDNFGDDDLVFHLDIGSGPNRERVCREVLRGFTGLVEEDEESALEKLDEWLGQGDETVLLAVDSSQYLPDLHLLDALVDLLRRHTRFFAIIATREFSAGLVDVAQAVDTVIITQRELTFRADDSLELFRSYGLGDDVERCTQLHEAVDGWPTLVHRGVIALDAFLPRDDDGKPVWPAGSGDVVLKAGERARDYIASTMLPKLIEPEQLDLGRRCALVGGFDSSCLHLLRDDVSQDDPLALATLEDEVRDLARDGVLGTRRETNLLFWSMPDLIADALRAQDGLPADQARALQMRFIDHHLALEDWRAAMKVAVFLDAPEVLADIVARGWIHLAMTHPRLLDEAFARIPDDVLAANAGASSARVIMQNAVSTIEHAALPDEPEALRALATKDDVGQTLIESLTITTAIRAVGDVHKAAADMERLLQLLDHTQREQPEATVPVAPAIHVQAAVCRQLVGDLVGADHHFREALQIGADDQSGTVTLLAESGQALGAALAGRMDEAQRWVDRAAAHVQPPGWIGRRLLTPRLVAEGWIALERMDWATLDPLVARLRSLADDDELWGFIVTLGSMHDLIFEDSWTAIDNLERLRRRRSNAARPGSYADVAVSFALADHQLVLGQGTRASQTIEGVSGDHPGTGIRRALIALMAGRPEATLAETFEGDRLSIRRRSHLELLRACAHLALDDLVAAREGAERSLRLMNTYGLRSPLRFVPTEPLAELLERVDLDDAYRVLLREAIDRHPSPLPARLDLVTLTDRERSVLNSIALGLSAQQMASADYVSVNTIKSQARTLYRKLGATSRREALTRARELGLIAEA